MLSAVEVMCSQELVSRGADGGDWRVKRQQCPLVEKGKCRGRTEGVGRRKGWQGMRRRGGRSRGRKAQGAVGG